MKLFVMIILAWLNWSACSSQSDTETNSRVSAFKNGDEVEEDQGADAKTHSGPGIDEFLLATPANTGGRSLATAAPFSAKTILGPFTPAPALTFYWLNNPASCRARVRVTTTSGENALLRVYAVNDALSEYKEKMLNKVLISLPKPSGSGRVTSKIIELPPLPAATPNSMIEIRLSTGQNRLSAYVESECAIKDSDYGVSFQNGFFSPWRGLKTESLFAYVPYHAEILVFANKGKAGVGITGVSPSGLLDATSNEYGPVNGPVRIDAGKSLPIIPRRVSWAGPGVSDVLWKFDFVESTWKFAAGGFPLILSPSAAAVRRIRAGLVFDGKSVLAHGFQRDYLRYIRPKMAYKTGSTAALADAFATMLSDGGASLGAFPNRFLTNGQYGLLTDFRSAIDAQNLNPSSDWLGSSDGWQRRDPKSAHYAGASALIPSEIYASSSNNVGWQLVVKPVAGAVNHKYLNTVSVVKGTTKTTMPLSDPTHWNRLSVIAPIFITDPSQTSGVADSRTPLIHGVSSMDDTLSPSLALMALLDAKKAKTPFSNPFYAQKPLLYRAALAGMTDLANLPESEIWNFMDSDLNGQYAGGIIAFTMGRKVMISYGEVAFFLRKLFCSSAPSETEKKLYNCSKFSIPALSPEELSSWAFTPDEVTLWKEIFANWTTGVQRVAYRLYPNDMVSSRNQSAHYLIAYQQLARGTGDPFDIALVNDYVDRWVQSQDPSGYFMEQQGPDASYIGMTNFHAAIFYLTSCHEGACNQKIKESIAKTYKFFGYTVAPEPNSTSNILGGFNFNHRVGAGFHSEQFGGARGIALDIPEVSAWTSSFLAPNGKAAMKVPPLAHYVPAKSRRLDIGFQRFDAFQSMTEAAPAPFPATQAGSFTTDVYDAKQLIAVKRPGYYTSVYVGRPAFHPSYIASSNNPEHRLAWANNGESKGASIGDPHYWSAPYVGGGMSLFWTPEFGSSVLAGNWSPLVHHGLVAVDGQSGVRSWEDYFSTSYSLASDNSSLSISGRIESKPCVYASTPQQKCSGIAHFRYVRNYKFLNDTIKVTTTIFADEIAEASDSSTLFENIPLAGGKPKLVGDKLPVLIQVSPQEVTYRAANSGPGIRIRYKDHAFNRAFTNGPMNQEQLQINRLELGISIPNPGESSTLQYCLQPVSADPTKCGY
jgi:hypothetical protein